MLYRVHSSSDSKQFRTAVVYYVSIAIQYTAVEDNLINYNQLWFTAYNRFCVGIFIDKIGYRLSVLIAHLFAALGLISIAILPDMMNDSFMGIFISVLLYAVGGGLLEVVVSPIVEACPNEHKDKTMSMLHSFYCWGTAGVVVISTIFFNVFGIDNWKILALVWAAVPVINGLTFLKVPIAPLINEEENGLSLKELIKQKAFWGFYLLCAVPEQVNSL